MPHNGGVQSQTSLAHVLQVTSGRATIREPTPNVQLNALMQCTQSVVTLVITVAKNMASSSTSPHPRRGQAPPPAPTRRRVQSPPRQCTMHSRTAAFVHHVWPQRRDALLARASAATTRQTPLANNPAVVLVITVVYDTGASEERAGRDDRW